MKVLKITVFILLVLNIVQSCTKDSSKTDNPALQLTLENLVNTYNKDVVLDHEKAIYMEGEMTMMTLPSKEVLFFLKRDGATTNEIFLGQGTELSSMLQTELGKVKVAYMREALAIETETGEIYTFTIGERKGHEFVQKLTSTWEGKGYGLAFRWNRTETPSDYKGLSSEKDLKPRASTCKCELSGGPSTPCDSGGPGSSSCSIGATSSDPGCSTSCNTGYYACCNNA